MAGGTLLPLASGEQCGPVSEPLSILFGIHSACSSRGAVAERLIELTPEDPGRIAERHRADEAAERARDSNKPRRYGSSL
jgi:hypothetical protein